MPAGQTYDSIATTTISSNVTSLSFTNISSSYTDLIVVCSNFTSTAAGGTIYFQFNGDTGSNYSTTEFYGNGTSAASVRLTSTTILPITYFVTTGTTQTGQIAIAHIMNYSNTTTNKTVLARENNASDASYPGAGAVVGLWRSTAAINRIDLSNNSKTWNAGTVTIYGITAA
jgi:hypothetical protein